jgi:phosphopantothenoylcysteine decarboxylase/phosphopantothenate--cysteine ligase
VGFAAETGDPRARARQKLAAKQVDLIVANDVSRADAGFETDTNAAVLISADGEVEEPLQLKTELASKILDRVEKMLKMLTGEERGARSEERKGDFSPANKA